MPELLGTKLTFCARCAQETIHVVAPHGTLGCHRCAAKVRGAELRKRDRPLTFAAIAVALVGLAACALVAWRLL